MKKRLQTLLKLGIMSGIVLYIINKSIASSSVARNLMKTSENHYYEWRNGTIYYTKRGTGAPLLLIHDLYPSSSAQEWTEVIDRLAADHTVYALDLPGCGRSEKPATTYTNYFFVQMLSDFINDVIGECTDIVATGISSSFVIMTANMHPELIGKFAMVNPLSPKQLSQIPDHKSQVLNYLANVPIISTSFYYLMMSQNQIEYDFSEKYLYNPFHLNSRMIHTYYESAHLNGSDGKYLFTSLKSNYVNINVNAALSKITQEIHMISGSHMDNSDQIVDAYCKLKSDIHPHVVDKAKLLPQLEAPDVFIKLCDSIFKNTND
ncbi:MAG: alpha/beta fold hydrolase [Eubacteriales bacterium]|nr:alpha/beta fold hydrolase [Eubacteriales bacterium]